MKLLTKKVLAAIFSALCLAGMLASGPAMAHRTSVGIGFSFGYPGYWYPAPYYYYPPYPPAYPYYGPYYPYGYPAGPVTYVEQPAPQQQRQDQWWYYCADARAYYPYVRECAGGWQRVAPTPPADR